MKNYIKKSIGFLLVCVACGVFGDYGFAYAAQTVKLSVVQDVTVTPSNAGAVTTVFTYTATLSTDAKTKMQKSLNGRNQRCGDVTFTPSKDVFTSVNRTVSFAYKGGESDFNCDIVAIDEAGNTSNTLNLNSTNKPASVCLVVPSVQGAETYSIKGGNTYNNATCTGEPSGTISGATISGSAISGAALSGTKVLGNKISGAAIKLAAQTIKLQMVGAVAVSPKDKGAVTTMFTYTGTMSTNKNAKIKFPQNGRDQRCIDITFTPRVESFATGNRTFSFTYTDASGELSCDIIADDENGNISNIVNINSNSKPVGVCLQIDGGYSTKDGVRYANNECKLDSGAKISGSTISGGVANAAVQTIKLQLVGGIAVAPTDTTKPTSFFTYTGIISTDKEAKIKIPPLGNTQRCSNIELEPTSEKFATGNRTLKFIYTGESGELDCDIIADDEKGNISNIVNINSIEKPAGVCLWVSRSYSIKDGAGYNNPTCTLDSVKKIDGVAYDSQKILSEATDSAVRNAATSGNASEGNNLTPGDGKISGLCDTKNQPINAECLAKNLTLAIVNPIIYLLFFVGFGMFVFSVIKYVVSGSEDSKKRADSIKLIIFSLFGLFVVTTAYGIMKTLAKIGNGSSNRDVVEKIKYSNTP